MAKRIRRLGSLKKELLDKSREAALNAIRTYNDPQVAFKSETYIVLMVIAWTYLLHAYYRSKEIEYRYFEQKGGRRYFHKTKNGAFKHWELERCLNEPRCPIDKIASNNLRFLIGLRHEIEHQMTLSLDSYLSGRAVNYNNYAKNLFGKECGIDSQIAYSIQFLQLSEEQLSGLLPEAKIPERIRSYITEYDGKLNYEEYNSSRYSFRLLFTKKLVNKSGQADRVIEFIDPKSDLAKAIDKEYWVKKEVERPKYRATDVVAEIHKAGFRSFVSRQSIYACGKPKMQRIRLKAMGSKFRAYGTGINHGSIGVSSFAGRVVSSTSENQWPNLLFDRFNRNKTHVWAANSFTNRFRIIGVVLATLNIWFHKLRRH